MGKAINDEVLLALAKKGGGGGGGGTDDYEDLAHKPQVNGHTLEGNKTTSDLGIKFEDLPDAPTIPNDLADLQDDSTHRLVTDAEKATWDGKSDFSGSYNDLTDKPTIPSQLSAGDYVNISNGVINVQKEIGTYDNIRYNFTPTDNGYGMIVTVYVNNVQRFQQTYNNVDVRDNGPYTIKDLIQISYGGGGYYWHYMPLIDSNEHPKNTDVSWFYSDMTVHDETFDVPQDDSTTLVVKGDLGTASSKDVPASGDASSSQVVMGNDSRLTDSRPASDVSSWAKQSTKPTYTASEVGAIATTQKGVASGVAELDANGKVPSSQLPSYVDDVVEGYYDTTTDRFYTESTFENVIPPESGKSWVDVASNKSYRWTGSVYSRVDEGVQLGETSGSAYRGDRGKVAYDHSQTTGNPHSTTKSDVGLSNVPNVSTNDQEPTFTEASTRNNIASGEKLSVIMGKIQKFFNDLKTVAFSGSFSDLSNKPSINSVELSGNKTTSDLGLQDELTFDNTPTDGSNNPVKSDGVYDSEKDIYAVMGQMGAKNLNSYPYSENSKTVNGVTFTVNTDGSVSIQTDAGGATGSAVFMCHSREFGEPNDLVIPNGNYILTGCPAGGGTNKYKISASATKNGVAYLYGADVGNGVAITLDGDDYSANEVNIQLYITISQGIIITTPITFKPMLRLASDTDDTYQPYAKTNKQLTDEIATKTKNFQGTIAEWNALSTAEKKAYDHASIPDSLDGNVTFPASKVMLNSGDSVEDAISNKHYGTAVSLLGYTSSSNYFTCPADGIVLVNCGSSQTSHAVSLISIDLGDTIGTSLGTGSGALKITVPVLKGQKLWASTNAPSPTCNYYPIEY